MPVNVGEHSTLPALKSSIKINALNNIADDPADNKNSKPGEDLWTDFGKKFRKPNPG
jgi:hypothetical protein